MLSEQDKRAILNGTPARTRNGLKVIYVGVEGTGEDSKCVFIVYRNERIFSYINLNSEMCIYNNKKHGFDIIGLWEESNELEPFNLERALSGEPVITKDGSKAFILKQINDNLIGYFDESSPARWDIDGTFDRAAEHSLDIIGMWQEPKRPTVTLTLPCPLKVLNKGEVFFRYTALGNIAEEVYKALKHQERDLERGRCFSSREDAKAWANALKNNRK